MCGGDVVLAAADAKFSISETTLGVPPAQSRRSSRNASAWRARGGYR
jgi:enoyl-CoA hydratase/carnithine racemase